MPARGVGRQRRHRAGPRKQQTRGEAGAGNERKRLRSSFLTSPNRRPPSSADHPEEQVQQQAQKQTRHQRHIECKIATLDDDIAGHAAKPELAEIRPQQAEQQNCNSEHDQKARHRSTCRASFLPSHLGHEPDFAMTNAKFRTTLIVGAGAGLSASLARALAKDGIKVALAARPTGDLDALVKQTGARAFACDATERAQVEKLFADVDASLGAPDIVIYNASFRTRGPFVDLDPNDVEKALAVTAY